MNPNRAPLLRLGVGVVAVGLVLALFVLAQKKGSPPAEDVDPADAGLATFGGLFPPGPRGPGAPGDGNGPGGFGGPMGPNHESVPLLKQFDEDRNGWLDATERKAAREHLAAQGDQRGPVGGRGPRGGGPPGFGGGAGFLGFNDVQGKSQPGPSVSPADVAVYPDAPLYDAFTLRTLFLEFDSQDWEKELEEFHGTDVDLPATLEVDGQTFRDVGVRFRGNTSYMMVRTGLKRPLNLTLDLVHPQQELDGYQTLNLLNAHEDPSFLRSVLYYQIARHYVPAPQANFVRLVINGESWGVYVNVQQFDSTFTRDFFGTPKGARWKVPGSPGGQGGFAYLGEEIEPYRRIYELKSKENLKSWVSLILLCQTLNETPPELMESALAPILDIDGVLRFLALDNVLVNNDGFWVRASDFCIYLDVHGQFHVIPYDANETFAVGGSGPPGMGGRPGGPGGGGQAGFGPGMFLAPVLLKQADRNKDQMLDREEFIALADHWFEESLVDKAAALDRNQFEVSLAAWMNPSPESGFQPAPVGDGPPMPKPGGGFSPLVFIANDFFIAMDDNQDGSITFAEMKAHLTQWAREWSREDNRALTETLLASGLNSILSGPGGRGFGGRPGNMRGGGGRGGLGGMSGGGPGMGPGRGGVELDPLVLVDDARRPLASKLLAVPELRARYLSYVRDIAENWVNWEKTGSLVLRYRRLIEEDIKTDTRKLDSTQDFFESIDGGDQAQSVEGLGSVGNGERSLRDFFERRRAFLLQHPEVKKAAPL